MWKLDYELKAVKQDDKARCAVLESFLCRPCGGQHGGGQAACWEAGQEQRQQSRDQQEMTKLKEAPWPLP